MRNLLTLPLMMLATGCFHLSVQRGDPRPVTASSEFMVHSFLFTTIPGRQPPPAQQVCVGKTVEGIAIKMKALDVLIGVATVGIYTPHHVTISCSAATETKTAPTNSRQ